MPVLLAGLLLANEVPQAAFAVWPAPPAPSVSVSVLQTSFNNQAIVQGLISARRAFDCPARVQTLAGVSYFRHRTVERMAQEGHAAREIVRLLGRQEELFFSGGIAGLTLWGLHGYLGWGLNLSLALAIAVRLGAFIAAHPYVLQIRPTPGRSAKEAFEMWRPATTNDRITLSWVSLGASAVFSLAYTLIVTFITHRIEPLGRHLPLFTHGIALAAGILGAALFHGDLYNANLAFSKGLLVATAGGPEDGGDAPEWGEGIRVSNLISGPAAVWLVTNSMEAKAAGVQKLVIDFKVPAYYETFDLAASPHGAVGEAINRVHRQLRADARLSIDVVMIDRKLSIRLSQTSEASRLSPAPRPWLTRPLREAAVENLKGLPTFVPEGVFVEIRVALEHLKQQNADMGELSEFKDMINATTALESKQKESLLRVQDIAEFRGKLDSLQRRAREAMRRRPSIRIPAGDALLKAITLLKIPDSSLDFVGAESLRVESREGDANLIGLVDDSGVLYVATRAPYIFHRHDDPSVRVNIRNKEEIKGKWSILMPERPGPLGSQGLFLEQEPPLRPLKIEMPGHRAISADARFTPPYKAVLASAENKLFIKAFADSFAGRNFLGNLGIRPGDRVLAFDPIHAALAAIQGAEVDVRKRGPPYFEGEPYPPSIDDLIAAQGGHIAFVDGDMEDPAVQRYLKAQQFDHVLAAGTSYGPKLLVPLKGPGRGVLLVDVPTSSVVTTFREEIEKAGHTIQDYLSAPRSKVAGRAKATGFLIKEVARPVGRNPTLGLSALWKPVVGYLEWRGWSGRRIAVVLGAIEEAFFSGAMASGGALLLQHSFGMDASLALAYASAASLLTFVLSHWRGRYSLAGGRLILSKLTDRARYLSTIGVGGGLLRLFLVFTAAYYGGLTGLLAGTLAAIAAHALYHAVAPDDWKELMQAVDALPYRAEYRLYLFAKSA